MEDLIADGSVNGSANGAVKGGLHFGHQLNTVGNELEAFADNPARLERDRTRFDRDVEIVFDDRADTVIEGETLRKVLGMPSKRPCEGDLRRAWENSFPGRQFKHQVDETFSNQEFRFGASRQDRRERAEATIREDWKEQGIWNEKWGIKLDRNDLTHRWMHEESPGFPSTSEVGTLPAPNPNMSSHLESAELRSSQPDHGTNSQEAAERPAKQKHNHDASRPFQQFIHQLSKQCEQTLANAWLWPDKDVDEPCINTTAYETVRHLWEKRLIWNEEWGTMPGRKWKHEEPFQMPEEVPSPEPKSVADDIARKCEPWLVGLDQDFVPDDAERTLPADKRHISPVDEEYALPFKMECTLPDDKESRTPKRGQGARKRKATTANNEPQLPRRNVSRKSQSNIPKSRAEVKKNGSAMAVHGQEDSNPHMRRSKRLKNRASSSKKLWIHRGIWNENWGILQDERRRKDALKRWLVDVNLDSETPERNSVRKAKPEALSSLARAVRSQSTSELENREDRVDGRRRSKRLAKLGI
ncbi:unnamed protein product [Penicillium bialowiezense]